MAPAVEQLNRLCSYVPGSRSQHLHVTTELQGLLLNGWPETSNWSRPLRHLLFLLILTPFFQGYAIILASAVLEHSQETLEYQIN